MILKQMMVKNHLQTLKIWDKIVVDKGMLGKDKGVLESIDGCSAFGEFGTYRTSQGEIKGWDKSIHKIYPTVQIHDEEDFDSTKLVNFKTK